MAKLQSKKSPAPRGKVKKEAEDEEIASQEQAKVEEKEEVKGSEATDADHGDDTDKGTGAEEEAGEEEDGIEETAGNEAAGDEEAAEKEGDDEETKPEDEEEKPSADGKEDDKGQTPRRRRRRGKKPAVEGETKPSENGKPKDEKPLAGLIFMCSKKTKEDCFKHKVFGLPEGKKATVEKITQGMKLFLFDVNERVLHGVYQASSDGGENLEPDAFKSSKKTFPAQVRFRIKKDRLPLSEDDFKPSIKENYYDKTRFNIELSAEQVRSLEQAFGLAASKAKKDSLTANKPKKDVAVKTEKKTVTPTVRKKFQRVPPVPSRRDDRRYSAGYVPSRLPAYALDPGYAPADPYLARAHLRSTDPVYRLGAVPDPVYRQSSIYSDALLRQAGKRPLDDLYVDDRYALPVPKRSHVQDELLYRNLEYQRLGPYADRYYAGLAPY